MKHLKKYFLSTFAVLSFLPIMCAAATPSVARPTSATSSVHRSKGRTGVTTASVSPATISVKDYGAMGDGVTDDTAAIQTAINAGEAMGAGTTVFFPAGRYVTTPGTHNYNIFVNAANNMTIQGTTGTVIMAGDLNQAVFYIVNSTNLLVENITVDHNPMGYTQGTVQSVNVAANTCEVSIDAGYPAPNTPGIVNGQMHPITYPAQGYYQLDKYWPNPSAMTQTGTNTWHWVLSGPNNIANWPGARFYLMGNTNSDGFVLYNLTNFTFQDVTYWGGGAAAAFNCTDMQGTTTFRRFVVDVPPNSGRIYSCDEGGQIIDLRGSLILDSCNFFKTDDDAIDIFSTWTRIWSQTGPRILNVQSRGNDYRTGDNIEIWDWRNKIKRSVANVVSSSLNADGSYMLTLDRDVYTVVTGHGVGYPNGAAAMTDGIDRLINVSTVGTSTSITNCKFQVYRAKCLNLKAANCTVDGCTFSSSFTPAVFASPEWYFEEGPPIKNLIVRNCTFTNCNHYNIDIGASNQTGIPNGDPTASKEPRYTTHDSSNVLIQNNTFTGYGTVPSVFSWIWAVGGAILVTNTQGVTITGNSFGPLASTTPVGTQKIQVQKSLNVAISNNTGVP